MSIPNGIRVAGKIEPIDCPTRMRFARMQGETWTFAFRGLADEAWARFVANSRTAIEGEFDRADGEATARASLTYQSAQQGATELAPQTLEVDFHEISGSIFKNATFVGISGDRIKAIQRVLHMAEEPDSTSGDVENKIDEEGITNGSTEMDALNLLLLGITEYTWLVPVLTYTRLLGDASSALLPLATAGQVWNDGRVGDYLGAKAILFALSQMLGNSGGAFPGIATPTGFSRGWMHKAKLNATANGSWQMVEIFECGAWSDKLYPKDLFAATS